MIKVKKYFSLLIIVFLILSNVAFAEYSNSDSISHEQAIDDYNKSSGEYHQEGQTGEYQEKGQVMERFMRGEANEEEMRAMAKAKMGSHFSEEEFQRMMKEAKQRMEKKDAFSYEHEGFQQSYDSGPSYEGYSKEQIIFGRVFRYIGDDIDPREIKDYCSDPNKMADIVIGKLKEKLGDLQKICSEFEDNEAKCNEMMKNNCARIGTAMIREGATEMEKRRAVAYSCPVNKDAIIEACKIRDKSYIEQKVQNTEKSCQARFDFAGEKLVQECDRFRQSIICDKDKFIGRCMGGVRKENFENKKPECPYITATEYPVPKCEEGATLHEKTNSIGCFIGWECVSVKTTNICPTQIAPSCSSGQTIQKKTDEKGCIYYYCAACAPAAPAWCPHYECLPDSISVQNPTTCCYECKSPNSVVPHCRETDGGYDIYAKGVTYSDGVEPGKSDVCINDKTLAEYGCNPDGSYGGDKQYSCEIGCSGGACLRSSATTTTATICPESPMPTCASGQTLQKKTDEKGCVYYYCETVATTTTNQSNNTITGSAIYTRTALNTYDDYVKQCENSWLQQQKTCANMPTTCDRNAYIEKCKEQEQKNAADYSAKIGQHCESDTISQIRHAEQRCSKIDEERKRCLEQSAKRCEQMKGLTQQCRDTLTEEKLRNFIVEEVKKRCKFTDIIENEDELKKSEKAEVILAVLNTATQSDFDKLKLFVDNLEEDLKLQDTTVYKGTIEPSRFGDIKLLPFVVNAKLSSIESSARAKEVKTKIVSGKKAEDAASKLVSLRDSDVPKEYLYIIEDKASEVLNVSDKLDEIQKKEDQKGFGYKLRLFLGLAKKAEQEEIKQLQNSKEKLNNSIDVLTKLTDEIPSDVAKSILKEQVENLKKQQEEIDALVKAKEKKSKGLFGIFG